MTPSTRFEAPPAISGNGGAPPRGSRRVSLRGYKGQTEIFGCDQKM